MTPILTIAIPTYNRAPHLRHLLAVLAEELRGVSDVELLISDNASTDDTLAVIREYQSRLNIEVISNQTNLGAEPNVAQVFERARTEYVWVFGDDDAPKVGAVAALLGILKRESPDLVAIPSKWLPDIRIFADEPIEDDHYLILDSFSFARRVNWWVSFLSGVVVNKQRFYEKFDHDYVMSCIGTNLVHLSWVLGLLDNGNHFIQVDRQWVLATADNTGGYRVLETFAKNFSESARALCVQKPALARQIMTRVIVDHLPWKVWDMRFARDERFTPEDHVVVLRKGLGHYPGYWLFLRPIAEMPRVVASAALLAARVFAAVRRRWGWAIDRLAGAARRPAAR